MLERRRRSTSKTKNPTDDSAGFSVQSRSVCSSLLGIGITQPIGLDDIDQLRRRPFFFDQFTVVVIESLLARSDRHVRIDLLGHGNVPQCSYPSSLP